MLFPIPDYIDINNFILVKYSKKKIDAPKHVKTININKWNECQELMFETMLKQLNFFYPAATIHVLTNERHRNSNNLIWYYRPNLEDNHNTKLLLYGLLNAPAMYLDTDILLNKPFSKKHLETKHPFNLYRLSFSRSFQGLAKEKLEIQVDKQYNCGIIWIPRPNKQIVTEMQRIKNKYFNERDVIEEKLAWFNNDEHPVSYFVAKYEMRMRLFDDVNVFRAKCKYDDIFKAQSVHYTGLLNKNLLVKEYKKLCKSRDGIIFS